MFAKVWAYILQHSAASASDQLSAIEVKTLVGNHTTTSRTPLAPIDANANGGRVLQHNCRTIKVVAKSGSDDELLESLLAYVLDNETMHGCQGRKQQLKVLSSNHNNHDSTHISILLEPRLLGSIPSKKYQATSDAFLRTAFRVSNEKQNRGDDSKQPCQMKSTVGVPKLAIISHGIDLQGTTNYTMITKALREWNKANGEDEKSSYSSANGSFR
jgi:hypothetical protein